jgi:HD superfamily phosphohydrolase YqeK
VPDAREFDHQAILAELETLVADTYQLWDQEWVGFSWRNYTYDHVQRVRSLAKALCQREGGVVIVVDYAGLLHDITKSYDGEILMQNGKRILDEQGFWKNETLPPARHNRVTDLYDQMGLAGSFHNISGAKIAETLLAEYGLPACLIARVSEAIRSHLKPDAHCSVEGRCLYDADTIDANIGLPAFYRNIQINLHREERQLEQRQKNLAEYLQENMPEYLGPYLRERVPTWIYGKHNDFVSKMTTNRGREVALERIGRLRDTILAMAAEMEGYEHNSEYGRLSIICRFLLNNRNPALSRELVYLSNHWLHEAERTPGAVELVAHIRAEVEGKL